MASPYRARRYPKGGYRIRGIHRNIRSVFVPQTGRSYRLDALTPAEVDGLVSAGWPHIERLIPTPSK